MTFAVVCHNDTIMETQIRRSRVREYHQTA